MYKLLAVLIVAVSSIAIVSGQGAVAGTICWSDAGGGGDGVCADSDACVAAGGSNRTGGGCAANLRCCLWLPCGGDPSKNGYCLFSNQCIYEGQTIVPGNCLTSNPSYTCCQHDVPPAPKTVQGVIDYALDKVNRAIPYSWGGGNAWGPTVGTKQASDPFCDDINVLGFDCSGLTKSSLWAGLGMSIPKSSGLQWADYRANLVNVVDRKPGDLLFYGASPAKISHVALYKGKNPTTGVDEMIEAYGHFANCTGIPVGVNPVRLIPTNIRFAARFWDKPAPAQQAARIENCRNPRSDCFPYTTWVHQLAFGCWNESLNGVGTWVQMVDVPEVPYRFKTVGIALVVPYESTKKSFDADIVFQLPYDELSVAGAKPVITRQYLHTQRARFTAYPLNDDHSRGLAYSTVRVDFTTYSPRVFVGIRLPNQCDFKVAIHSVPLTASNVTIPNFVRVDTRLTTAWVSNSYQSRSLAIKTTGKVVRIPGRRAEIPGWYCARALYADEHTCNMGCGLVDPDCLIQPALPVVCPPNTTAYGARKCIPNKWTCSKDIFDSLDGCDGACGARDIDCSRARTPVWTCLNNETPNRNGVCTPQSCGNGLAEPDFQEECDGTDNCTSECKCQPGYESVFAGLEGLMCVPTI